MFYASGWCNLVAWLIVWLDRLLLVENFFLEKGNEFQSWRNVGRIGLKLRYVLVVEITMAAVANGWIVPLTFMFGTWLRGFGGLGLGLGGYGGGGFFGVVHICFFSMFEAGAPF